MNKYTDIVNNILRKDGTTDTNAIIASYGIILALCIFENINKNKQMVTSKSNQYQYMMSMLVNMVDEVVNKYNLGEKQREDITRLMFDMLDRNESNDVAITSINIEKYEALSKEGKLIINL